MNNVGSGGSGRGGVVAGFAWVRQWSVAGADGPCMHVRVALRLLGLGL